ncbi:hypothetical protein BCR36DRAFT_162762 [Piromyces finnis]|uniref:Uncharacterized protein n=1 Tax=Piromyces finnis TaxID=1754191 RepID=A0A1Y1VHM8_9FUNG|nr:hypothetical protein BCR36DRAFT_162762 [Piromyces finnis]|eukprot:ORX56530.1 hypothetical protein BCR36DRAFT_162762 [Piromyces finnis]
MSESINNKNEEIINPSNVMTNETSNIINVSDSNNNNNTSLKTTHVRSNIQEDNEKENKNKANDSIDSIGDENEIVEKKENDKQDNKDNTEFQYPTHSHAYSYNITNISNNREDLGAGFRSRLKVLGSSINNNTPSYNSNNVNSHISNNYQKQPKTDTTSSDIFDNSLVVEIITIIQVLLLLLQENKK